jgi:exodeoxyribonuclease VII small subunit
MENKEKKEMSFEECIEALEIILKNLERNDISLEDAVKGYTKGLELSKKCYEILSTNEALVVQKMTESGLVDFNKE